MLNVCLSGGLFRVFTFSSPDSPDFVFQIGECGAFGVHHMIFPFLYLLI